MLLLLSSLSVATLLNWSLFHRTNVPQQRLPAVSRVESRSKQALGVCIVGQLGRLELQSKADHVVIANREEYMVDVALVLDNGKHGLRFVDKHFKENGGGEVEYPTTWEMTRALQGARRVKVRFIEQPEKPLVRGEYLSGLDKDKMSSDARLERARIHLRQWSMLDICLDVLMEMESEMKARYDVLLKIREDGYVMHDLVVSKTFQKDDQVVANECDSWLGLNDKGALVGRDVGDAYFRGPLRSYYLYGDQVDWNKTTNPETFLYQSLSRQGVQVRSVSASEFPLIPSRKCNNVNCDQANTLGRCFKLQPYYRRCYHKLGAARWEWMKKNLCLRSAR